MKKKIMKLFRTENEAEKDFEEDKNNGRKLPSRTSHTIRTNSNSRISTINNPTTNNSSEKESTKKEDDEQFEFFPKPVFKRLVEKNLTIVLIENTAEVAKENAKIRQLLKSVSSELVCIIKYGSSIEKSEIFKGIELKEDKFLCDENVENKACLFDTLVELDNLISEVYMKTKEEEKERIRINKIDIIGIGTCIDTCSKVTKDVGIDHFCKVISKTRITTKYCCITERDFIKAAEIGFHSIGSMSINYQQ